MRERQRIRTKAPPSAPLPLRLGRATSIPAPEQRTPTAAVLRLQRKLGNRMVARLLEARNHKHIQAKPLTEEEKAQDLQSDALRDDQRLQQAFDNSPLLLSGETSEGVKTLQRALRDLNYPLPVSFAKTGDADGIFGQETKNAVYQFQVDHKLVFKDGIVGRETLQTMDQLLGTAPPVADCHFNYLGGNMSASARTRFLSDHFDTRDRPQAKVILDDLCLVTQDKLSFESEQELRDEILMRLRVSQYMKESQTTGGFAYPESAKSCPGKTGNPLLDAQVNVDAKNYWRGPILEERAAIKNSHYFFELTEDVGKQDAYQALKLLFTPKPNICDKTLIHCDTLITLTKALAYADTIGKQPFNEKIASGKLSMWLTYDGMSIRDNDSASTPVSVAYQYVVPSNEDDLVIGDHVTFWNHLAYDAISTSNPGPWRLENALLVDKDRTGKDLYEGHGAPAVSGVVKPGPKEDIHRELMNAYNPYARDALSITKRVENSEAGAQEELANKYPQVKSVSGRWQVKELDRNSGRLRQFYELRELTGPDDPEIVGLRNPDDPSKLNWVKRPVESK